MVHLQTYEKGAFIYAPFCVFFRFFGLFWAFFAEKILFILFDIRAGRDLFPALFSFLFGFLKKYFFAARKTKRIFYFLPLSSYETINIPAENAGYFSFGYPPDTTSSALNALLVVLRRYYLPPVNEACGSNMLNWSLSLSCFNGFAMYSLMIAVFFPIVST